MSDMNSEITAEGEIDITEMEKDVEDLTTREVTDHILSTFSDKYPEAGISLFKVEHTGTGGKYKYEIAAEDNNSV